jgi:hypothetical protein
MISALYVPARGLNPMESAAMKARADKTLATMLAADATSTHSVAPSETMGATTPTVLAWRSGCRLRRSVKRVATRIKHILTMLTPDGVAEDGLVGQPAGLAEHQRAVEHDNVYAGCLLEEVHADHASRQRRVVEHVAIRSKYNTNSV